MDAEELKKLCNLLSWRLQMKTSIFVVVLNRDSISFSGLCWSFFLLQNQIYEIFFFLFNSNQPEMT